MTKILFLADIGQASPRVPSLGEELRKLGYEVKYITPKMTKRQICFFKISNSVLDNLIMTNYLTTYRLEINTKGIVRIILKIARKIIDALRMKNLEPYRGFDNSVMRLLKKERDLTKDGFILISSSSPFAMHVAAEKVHQHFVCKWITDFRDPWTHNHARPEWVKDKNTSLELEVIKQSDVTITASLGFSKLLTHLHKRKVEVIRNGYSELHEMRAINIGSTIKLGYFGQIYPEYQNYKFLLKVIDELNRQQFRRQIQLFLVGASLNIVTSHYKKLGLSLPEWIIGFDYVTYLESLQLQKEMDFLIFFDWETQVDKGVVPTKLMEYIGAGVPILALGGPVKSESKELINLTHVGFNLQSKDELKLFLSELCNKSELPQIFPNYLEVEKFSISSQAKSLQMILEAKSI